MDTFFKKLYYFLHIPHKQLYQNYKTIFTNKLSIQILSFNKINKKKKPHIERTSYLFTLINLFITAQLAHTPSIHIHAVPLAVCVRRASISSGLWSMHIAYVLHTAQRSTASAWPTSR